MLVARMRDFLIDVTSPRLLVSLRQGAGCTQTPRDSVAACAVSTVPNETAHVEDGRLQGHRRVRHRELFAVRPRTMPMNTSHSG